MILSILNKLPAEYPYPKEELWGKYYEITGDYYYHASQPGLALDALTHAQKYVINYAEWVNQILTLQARCLFDLGEYQQILTSISHLSDDDMDVFSNSGIDRNLLRTECYQLLGNLDEAKRIFRVTETMINDHLEQPGLKPYIDKLNDLRNLIYKPRQ